MSEDGEGKRERLLIRRSKFKLHFSGCTRLAKSCDAGTTSEFESTQLSNQILSQDYSRPNPVSTPASLSPC